MTVELENTTLIAVDRFNEGHVKFLYMILQERLLEPESNISHKRLPTYDEHCSFVAGNPYSKWWLIGDKGHKPIGTAYLTHANEIGVFIRKDHRRRRHAGEFLAWLIDPKWYDEPKTFIANINPNNSASIKLFTRLCFEPTQLTYKKVAK